MKARVFIGSSSEQVDTAYAIQRNLERTCDATVWDQDVFALTSTILDDLVAVLDQTDFGIFVFGPDDLTTIRAKEYESTRDNVVFELGLFIGKLGKARTFFVMPRKRGDFRLPSDLVGVTPAEFDETREDRQAALGPACSLIREKITKLGIRRDRLIKLMRFLGLPSEIWLESDRGLVGIFIPTTEAVHCPDESQLPYTVRSVALADVQAVVEIVSMLTHLDILRGSTTFEPSNFFIHESLVDSFSGSTLFLVGGPLPNAFVRNILDEKPFGIEFKDLGHQLTISCAGIPAGTYSIRPPREGRTIRQTESYSTYGCIMKLRQENLTIFTIWGLDERGTRGAGRWLAANWEFALKQFGEGEFAAIVRFRPGYGTSAPDAVQRHPDTSIPILIPVTPSLSASDTSMAAK